MSIYVKIGMNEQLISSLGLLNVELSKAVAEQEIQFLDELLRWNQRINLTSVRNRVEACEKHLVDSLIMLKYLPASGRLLDIGSGGGLPGIPLAIARKGLEVTTVDSVGKKIHFQKHLKRLLQIKNLKPCHERLLPLGEDQLIDHPFDFAIARAFSSLDQLLEIALPRLKPGGKLLAMKGPEGKRELADLELDRFVKFCTFGGQYSYHLPSSRSERRLILFIKN